MTKHSFANTSFFGAAALLCGTSLAWADLSAPDVWSDWQETYSRYGGNLSAASEDYAGGTLTLEGVTITSDMAGAEGSADYGTITMVEQADGSIAVEMPAIISSTSRTEVQGVEVTQSANVDHENLSIIIREDGSDRVYDISADRLGVDFSSQVSGTGEAAGASNATMTVEALNSEYRSGLGAAGTGFTSNLEVGRATLSSQSPRGAGEEMAVSYALTGLAGSYAGDMGTAPDGPVTSLSDVTLTLEGDITHSGSVLSIAGDTPEGPLAINGTSDGGTLSFALGEETLGYGLSSTGAQVSVQSSNIPFPVNLSMQELSAGFDLPKGTPGDEQPFGLNVALRDLEIDDMIWNLFDPTGQLSRTPANLVIDLDGTAVMKVDLFGNPEAVTSMTEAPGDPKTLTLNELRVEFGGASLRGTGDLDFPTPGPVPEPVGTVELALDGGFALIDKIVALGFVPAQQATFVKGMAGMIARPVGEDKLESTIEFTPGGGISANGMPLK